MASGRRVFLHVCHGQESDPAPRRLQLKESVRFRNVLRTLGCSDGELYWNGQRVSLDDTPASVGMQGSLRHPAKLRLVPAATRALPERTDMKQVPACASRSGPKLLSPDPLILMNRRATAPPQPVQDRSVAAPPRLVSPPAPAGAHAAGPPRSELTYPSEAVIYTPRALWRHQQTPLRAAGTSGQHQYAPSAAVRDVARRTSSATTRRRNAPILQPPELLAAIESGDEESRSDSGLLCALQAEVRALRDELTAVRLEKEQRPTRQREPSLSSSPLRVRSSASPTSPHPRFPPRRRLWDTVRFSASPSARNPYLVDDLADEIHHGQLLRLAQLRQVDAMN